jgi:hypothetical protein
LVVTDGSPAFGDAWTETETVTGLVVTVAVTWTEPATEESAECAISFAVAMGVAVVVAKGEGDESSGAADAWPAEAKNAVSAPTIRPRPIMKIVSIPWRNLLMAISMSSTTGHLTKPTRLPHKHTTRCPEETRWR